MHGAIHLDAVGLDQRLAGLVVAFRLDALNLPELLGEDTTQRVVIVDDEVVFAVLFELLDNLFIAAHFERPRGDQLAIAHVRLLEILAQLDAPQLQLQAVADVLVVGGLADVQRRHQAKFDELRVHDEVQRDQV